MGTLLVQRDITTNPEHGEALDQTTQHQALLASEALNCEGKSCSNCNHLDNAIYSGGEESGILTSHAQGFEDLDEHESRQHEYDSERTDGE